MEILPARMAERMGVAGKLTKILDDGINGSVPLRASHMPYDTSYLEQIVAMSRG